jgi:hypothetical protein
MAYISFRKPKIYSLKILEMDLRIRHGKASKQQLIGNL